MERLYNWLLLKAIRGLGEVSIKRLWVRYGTADEILSLSLEDAKALIGEERAKALLERRLTFDPEGVIRLVEKEGIGWLTLEDENYPVLLKDLDDPPPVLFYRGRLKRVPHIAVVGTRKPDYQSVNFTRQLVRHAVEKGYAIASGGAIGIDLTAHLEALKYEGYTTCLLGMGILRMPTHLQRLQGDSLLFLSELLPEASPEEFTFPRRNRLISGMSLAVAVAEAGEKSGALITAEHAIRQRKPLWVYIGNSASQRWLGCIRLVNEGKAKILNSPSALFNSLPTQAKSEDPLLELLSTPKTFDELLELSGIDSPNLTLKLLQLEMEGKIVKNGSYYVVV